MFPKFQEHHEGNHRSVSLISVPGRIMEKMTVGVTEKHLKDNAVIGQNGFIRGKPCLTSFISIYDKVTHLADQRKPVHVISFDFR